METGGILNNQRNKESARDHVFNTVISAVSSGELKPGDRLPSELELSQSMGVGRNTVREAIKILEAYGVVAIRRPEGTFVSDSYSQKMLNPMLYGFLLRKQDCNSLIEMRGALEIGTMFIACRSATPQDFAVPESIIEDMTGEIHRESPSVDELIEYDRRFHCCIVEITGNPMIRDVTEYITELTIPSRKRATEMVLREGTIDSFIKKHCDMLDVLRKGDCGSIEKVVMNHYEYWIKAEHSEG